MFFFFSQLTCAALSPEFEICSFYKQWVLERGAISFNKLQKRSCYFLWRYYLKINNNCKIMAWNLFVSQVDSEPGCRECAMVPHGKSVPGPRGAAARGSRNEVDNGFNDNNKMLPWITAGRSGWACPPSWLQAVWGCWPTFWLHSQIVLIIWVFAIVSVVSMVSGFIL